MKEINIKITKWDSGIDDVELPKYETLGSSGLDIRAAIKEMKIISAGKYALIPTNISVEIPEGYEIQIRPRSGLAAKHGIGVLNSPGTIDSDYRGEIKIILFNFSDTDFVINRGDRIAQMVISEVIKGNFIISESLKESKRGANGFGHTGRD
ncbi:MAG: dUTP diphosphatase [Melioribacteraceae bacterium]